MKTIAYFDCPTGLSGDMILAALIDAGAPDQPIKEYLQKLPLPDWRMEQKTVTKNGLAANKIDFAFSPEHEHRHLRQIEEIIAGAALPPRAALLAHKVFHNLAQAEAAAHGVSIAEVHFHEVGALDTILDIVGVALAVDLLGIDEAYARPLPLAHGQINCEHGDINLPAPATLELLQGMELAPSALKGELITPTGAAIIKTLLAPNGFEPPSFTFKRQGRGAGAKDFAIANILRLYIGEIDSPNDSVDVLTAALDDINPELLGYLWQKALSAGALDMYYAPIVMKKGRPGLEITLLAAPGAGPALAQLLFAETTTLGLRIRQEKRLLRERSFFAVATPYGRITVKKAGTGPTATISPEYESCKTAAETYGVPLKTVYLAAFQATAQPEQEK